MVSPEGVLPSEKITDHYVEKTFGEDELNRTHPSFVWVFKASRNWIALKDLIPGMKENLESDPRSRNYYPGQGMLPDTISIPSTEDFSGMFKKLFCVAALNLANSLHEPVETLGPLFEEPLETGTLNKKTAFLHLSRLRRGKRIKQADIETNSMIPTVRGRGQYFFLGRRLSKGDVTKFGARGYRFASPKQITEGLAGNLQISQDVMLKWLERVRMYSSKENLMPPGRHLACFFLRPSVQKSFDVLVPTKAQSQLPHISFSFTESAQAYETLKRFNEWTVGSILKALIHQSVSSQIDHSYRWDLYRAFSQLVDLIGDPAVMMEAKFSAKKISAPCQPQANDHAGTSTCTLFSVRVIATVEARSPKPELIYVPLSFFSAQQQLEASPLSHEIFTKQAHLEFEDLGRSKTFVTSKSGSRKASTVDVSAPSTPTSFLRQISVGGQRRGNSRQSDETQEGKNNPPSEPSNDETIELTTSAHANHLCLGGLRDPDMEDTGNFASQLFALFKL